MRKWYFLLFLVSGCGVLSDEMFDNDKKATQLEVDLIDLSPNEVFIIDGYEVVEIGNLYWMTSNLATDTLANGEPIQEVKDTKAWFKLRSPGWCYYNNDPEYGKLYGKLYNWYAISDKNCLCPKGWLVASMDDWKNLINYYGGNIRSAEFLRSTSVWPQDAVGNNFSGLNVLPGGYRPTFDTADDPNIDFDGLSGAVYWSSTRDSLLFGFIERDLAWGVDVCSTNSYIASNAFYVGQSVRCVKKKYDE